MWSDADIRQLAFGHVAALTRLHGDALDWTHIATPVQGLRIANRPRGIFWPRQLQRGVLSVKTTLTRPGRAGRYDDSEAADDVFHYRLQGDDSNSRDNVRLRQSYEDCTPFIYFRGVSPSRYQPLWPAWVIDWHAERLTADICVTATPLITGAGTWQPVSLVSSPIARYATVQTKARLHQTEFRLRVLDAYRTRCAVCLFPQERLLEAAHIVPDSDPRGRPVVPNGLCLCALHHRAFDGHLLGVRPDGIVEISGRLRRVKDGPTLQHGFLDFDQRPIQQPRAPHDRPRREYLEIRYEEFQTSSS